VGIETATPVAVPDLLPVDIPVGGRVLVVSDLLLTKEATVTSTLATTEVAQAIDAWVGPGVLIFNGGGFELLARAGTAAGTTPGTATTGGSIDLAAALAAHPKFLASVKGAAAGPGRRIVYLPGSRDRRVTWDDALQRCLRDTIGAEIALAAELRIETGTGPRVVRVDPGQRFDPLSAPADPRSPAESPFGQHIVCEVLPALSGGGATGGPADKGWLAGVEFLDDPGAFPRFLASRLAYRGLARRAWWLTLPFAVAVLLRLPFMAALSHQSRSGGLSPLTRRLLFVGTATVIDLMLVAIVAVIAVRRTWTTLSGVALARSDQPADDPNEAARAEARQLVTAGHAGLITGHTRHPELTHLGCGFYANAGCATEVVSEEPARLASLGLPSVFLAHRQLSWVELEAGAELHARLINTRADLAGAALIERVVARPRMERSKEFRPRLVASFPTGDSWPAAISRIPQLKRIRRWAAALVGLAGIMNLVSGLYEPLRDRLNALLRFTPLLVPETATALVALGGLALLMLARGVRRGQRQAWVICEVVLTATAVLHLIKGVDVEEAIVAGFVALFLFAHRGAFTAGVDRPSARRGLMALAGGALVAVLAGGTAVELGTLVERRTRGQHHRWVPWGRALAASAERMAGIRTIKLGHRLDQFFTPAMLTITAGLLLAAAWLLFRPVVARRLVAGAAGGPDLARARDVVRRHGSGTLDYFALRADKQFFFWGDSVVAYGVYGGVCLVSPDPIGPESEREETWRAFRRFADQQGWTLAVLGAGEEWLPIYRATGMHDLYVGDEGVIDTTRFSLDGGRHKGLRQAVNRIAKYGYTISFHDPASLDTSLREELDDVMTKSRRGDVERGFSMTLGRVFDPEDHGLLLAVVHGPGSNGNGKDSAGGGAQPGAGIAGEPVAFCQFVPARGIDGYSLDLMRRDAGEHPNGLIDFAIVETIRHLRGMGKRGLGLNFATMRAVLAGESGEGLSQRVQAWLLRRMSDSMQIESLWKFNAKFDPDWQPRYALYDAPEHALPAAIAVARAESFWELPLIGRFLVPGGGEKEQPVAGEPRPVSADV
jgi:lysylphosphatidylglycerol synthetase-like protein (DUF2156 family)